MVISSEADQWLPGAGAGWGLMKDSKEYKETFVSDGYVDYPE